ncbi:hypothetical protein LXL04_036370 [Taraxacum kok-saghyz]
MEFSFDPNLELGLGVASCLITRQVSEHIYEIKIIIIACHKMLKEKQNMLFALFFKTKAGGCCGSKRENHLVKLLITLIPSVNCIRYTPNMKKHIGMNAGGSGITPRLQVIEAIVKNPDDTTKVSLIYANVSPDDILLKKETRHACC